MSTAIPQSFSDHLDSRIKVLLTNGMTTLISPVLNPKIAPEVPALYDYVLKAVPKASGHQRGALHAALWLLADDLATAHSLCQNIPTSFGSAWHAIMHRREGDFSNSKYWWRRATGIMWKTPTTQSLHAQLSTPLADAPAAFLPWRSRLAQLYDPAAFVDLVEQHQHGADPAVTHILLEVQRLEWRSLFFETLYQPAVANP